MEALPLSEIAPATVARVEELRVYSEDATRLRAMGICVGRQVQLMRAGDPLILRVLGTRVGVSARLAEGVGVVPVT
ncbi:MAG: ferrous iron transport protein A [Planctomycetes bacterium]|nr:ferrous iron transport protein A [Planctomycetota bacterium]